MIVKIRQCDWPRPNGSKDPVHNHEGEVLQRLFGPPLGMLDLCARHFEITKTFFALIPAGLNKPELEKEILKTYEEGDDCV